MRVTWKWTGWAGQQPADGLLEGQQPHCLNSYEGQVWIAQKKLENQKFDSEERGYFGVTKKIPECLNSIVWIAPIVWMALSE